MNGKMIASRTFSRFSSALLLRVRSGDSAAHGLSEALTRVLCAPPPPRAVASSSCSFFKGDGSIPPPPPAAASSNCSFFKGDAYVEHAFELGFGPGFGDLPLHLFEFAPFRTCLLAREIQRRESSRKKAKIFDKQARPKPPRRRRRHVSDLPLHLLDFEPFCTCLLA